MAEYHPQVRIRANGHEGYVDEGMRGIIRALWQCDIPTVFSCQGGIAQAPDPYITFPSYAIDDFLATLTGDNGLIIRALSPLSNRPAKWTYASWPIWYSDLDGPTLLTQVTFDAADITLITGCLEGQPKKRVLKR